MNAHGGITLDFLFALVLVLSMTMLLGVFSFSLAVIESTQYIAFSSSRAYFPSHKNKDAQRLLAEKKFEELTKSGGFASFLKPDFFKVTIDSIGDSSEIYQKTDAKDVLEGVRLKVVLGILELQLPGFAAAEGPFETFVTSFIGRESTVEECQNFHNLRFQSLLNLPGYQSASVQADQYFAYDDNGC